MTENDLTTMLREHVRADEPPMAADAGAAILAGRRTLRRRRVQRAVGGIAVLGAAAAVLPVVLGGGSGGSDGSGGHRGVDPATAAALADYDASRMPSILRETAGPLAALARPGGAAGPGTFTAGDDQGVSLPEKYWGKASGMDLTYGPRGSHQLRVALMHSRSEAEGDARKNCRNDVTSGYAFSCEVTSAGGDVATVRVFAVRALEEPLQGGAWGAVTRDELRTGKVVAGDPSRRPIDRDEIYFVRSVESVHSETFLTVVDETVKAPTYAAALRAFAVPVTGMLDVVSDPSLVMPKPPIGENGCAFMLHPENVTCGVDAPGGD